jgi:hypothetical protein
MEEGDRDRQTSARQANDHPYGGQSYNPIPYPHEYPQDSQGRQPQYSSYGANMEYGLPQPPGQSYAPMQSYPPRQNAAIEVLSSQFSGGAQYYVAGDSPTPVAPASTPHHQQHQQQSAGQFSSPSYSQYSPAAARLPHPYTSSTPDLNPPVPAVASEPAEGTEYATQNQAAALDEAYAQYQAALKKTFQNMHEGRLGEAGTSLLTISDWLLSNAVALGTC